MVKRRGSSFTSRSNAPAEHGAGQDPTRGGDRVGSYPTSQPRVVTSEKVQNQVDWEAPTVVSGTIPIVKFPADAMVRLLNIIEALLPNQGRVLAHRAIS
ncbi:hypothetical protein P3L10_032982 [Capsicum annuum]